ncbi:MAG: hypothetical protein K9G58_05780 [Bacteroidales bacterium]|nr:hypothetical protein [Bacteroidales bacterium]MCF8387163.1 hypothetical protein [Bacteroidales bacterium]MCF8397655.1 hypothetical protein [Bacteroidales bacterium]
MYRNLLLILISAAFMISCGNQQKKDNTSQEAEYQAPVKVTVANFEEKAGDLVGEMIVLYGTVDHVCQHGGKRMFIIDEGTDGRVKVVTGEDMDSFNTDMEGSYVAVEGIVDELRIDEAYLTEWENELMMHAEEGEMHEGEHKGDGSGHEGSKMGEEADQGLHIEGMEQIKKYRQQIKESGNDHLSFYSIVCTNYKSKKDKEIEG